MRACLAAAVAGTFALSAPLPVSGEPLDPALGRLVLDPSCRDELGRINDSDFAALEAGPGGRPYCAEDNVAFKKLVSQLGFALAPTAMHSARTTGFGGFDVAIEAAYTKISSDRSYWKFGTRGAVDPSSGRPATRNDDVPSVLQVYSVRLRKGFGFGIELAGAVGFLPKSSIANGGADLRVSLLEGFRSGIPGYIPDLAVGGGVRTITGTPELELTVASFDLQVSKPFPIQGMSVITPWIGFQRLYISGNSGTIDLTPGTDAQTYCGYAGDNVPGNPDPDKAYFDGREICTNPSPFAARDFDNDVTFEDVQLERQRLLLGASYRYELLKAGIQLITELSSPSNAQDSSDDAEALEGESRQWALVFELGAAF